MESNYTNYIGALDSGLEATMDPWHLAINIAMRPSLLGPSVPVPVEVIPSIVQNAGSFGMVAGSPNRLNVK